MDFPTSAALLPPLVPPPTHALTAFVVPQFVSINCLSYARLSKEVSVFRDGL